MTTLLDARNLVRMRTDQTVTSGTPFVSDAELNAYLNSSRAEHYDLLSNLFEDYNMSSQASTLGGATTTITAPVDLYKLRGVDLVLSPVQSISLERYNWRDRNRMATTAWSPYWISSWGPERRYRLQGQSIIITPTDSPAGNYVVWYTPVLADLVNDTDSFTSLGHWEDEYAIVDTCIKVMAKEESDPSVFIGQKGQLIERIQKSAANRDAGAPETITSTRGRSGGYDPFGSW